MVLLVRLFSGSIRGFFSCKFPFFKPTGLDCAVRQCQHPFSMALAVGNGAFIVRTVCAVENHKAPQIALVKFARIAIAIGQPQLTFAVGLVVCIAAFIALAVRSDSHPVAVALILNKVAFVNFSFAGGQLSFSMLLAVDKFSFIASAIVRC